MREQRTGDSVSVTTTPTRPVTSQSQATVRMSGGAQRLVRMEPAPSQTNTTATRDDSATALMESARLRGAALDRIVPARFREQASGIMHKFLDGLASLRSPWNILMVFFTSVLIWLLETVKYWLVMHAFKFTVSFIGLMLMNGVVNLATTIPAAPGGTRVAYELDVVATGRLAVLLGWLLPLGKIHSKFMREVLVSLEAEVRRVR